MPHPCLQLAELDVELRQSDFNRFTVRYGKQVKAGLSYAAAAAELGACIMHALACEGRLDNRTRTEARKAGDSRPYYDGMRARPDKRLLRELLSKMNVTDIVSTFVRVKETSGRHFLIRFDDQPDPS